MAGPKKKKKLKKKDKGINISERVKKGSIEGSDEALAGIIGAIAGTAPFIGGKPRRTGSPHTKYAGVKFNKGGSVDARKIAKKYFKGVY